jgi:hypothetical protein
MFEDTIARLAQAVHVVGVRRAEAESRERHGDQAGRSEREEALMKQLASIERHSR